MKSGAQLVLVRHGESERNVAKRGAPFFENDAARAAFKGVADHRVRLTDEGRAQAARTGKALAERFGSFDRVFHSGYTRTIDTTAGLLAAFPDATRERMPVQTHFLVRERDPGHAYDMTIAEARAAFPYMAEYWATTGGWFGHPPGGESLIQVAQRVQMFLDQLERAHANEHVLVVTHAGTLRAFRFLLEGWSYEEAEANTTPETLPPNCSVTTYVRVATGWQLQDAYKVY